VQAARVWALGRRSWASARLWLPGPREGLRGWAGDKGHAGGPRGSAGNRSRFAGGERAQAGRGGGGWAARERWAELRPKEGTRMGFFLFNFIPIFFFLFEYSSSF
jgi:hypothetical protein